MVLLAGLEALPTAPMKLLKDWIKLPLFGFSKDYYPFVTAGDSYCFGVENYGCH